MNREYPNLKLTTAQVTAELGLAPNFLGWRYELHQAQLFRPHLVRLLPSPKVRQQLNNWAALVNDSAGFHMLGHICLSVL